MILTVLRLGAFLCFAGWTWTHFYWEAPYGILLWHDATYQLAQSWGVDWDKFVGSGSNDGWVQVWLARTAWIFLACTLLTMTVHCRAWLQMLVILLGSGFLVAMSYAKYLAAQQQLPMFIEHGGQVLMPILLVCALTRGARDRVTVAVAIVAFIATFSGHGCYAAGLWPTPANFFAMTSVILKVDFETARLLLRIAGGLDFAVCVGILVPAARRSCVVYGFIWGLLTALARPVAGMSSTLYYWGADLYLHEALQRAPHAIIPLYLAMIWWRPHILDVPILDLPSQASENNATENAEGIHLAYTTPNTGFQRSH